MQIMMDVAASGKMIPVSDNLVTALLGYAVVFMGLMVLMAIVYALGAVFKSNAGHRKAVASTLAANGEHLAPAPVASEQPQGEPAPGSAGEVKLFDVPDKEAAMIMAIVADQMGKPLNELRFKSIKEVQ